MMPRPPPLDRKHPAAAPRRVESVTGCHQFSPPRDTLKDARRRCFAAVFPSFCRGFGLFWRDFSRIFGDFDG